MCLVEQRHGRMWIQLMVRQYSNNCIGLVTFLSRIVTYYAWSPPIQRPVPSVSTLRRTSCKCKQDRLMSQ